MEKRVTPNAPSSALALAPKLSPEQLLQSVTALMLEGLVRFPNSQPTEVQQKLYLVDWLEMARESGLERFAQAVHRTYRKVKFFPQPAEIADHLEPVGEVHKYSYQPPTAEEIGFRGSDEQKAEYQQVKAKVEEITKMPRRVQGERGCYTPSRRELAEALAANPYQQLLPEKVRER